MYGENENDNDYNDDSKLDKKTKIKYNSPIYNFFISFIIHICYLLIFLVFIYSVLIYNNQIFNSGVFDNIISKDGGYCSPFLERSYKKDTKSEEVNPKDEYSNISLFNLIKFDYIDTNINNNCNSDNNKKKIDISVETDEHTYGYGLVTFKKKYVNYLYYFFNNFLNKNINLSNWIYYIKYNNTSYAYNDNLITYSIRSWWILDAFWVLIDLGIALPIMFCIDTIRKSLVYNILIYKLIYTTLYNYINEGLLLLIFGFLFVYYPSLMLSLLFIFPCFITGITFFVVFIYNLFFQTYHYIMYSIEIFKKLMKNTEKSSKPYALMIKYWPLYCIRLLGTFLKIIIVFFMMINMYSCISPFFVTFFIVYTLIFLYIIIPVSFRGNTLNKDKNILNKISSMVGGGKDDPAGIGSTGVSSSVEDSTGVSSDVEGSSGIDPTKVDPAGVSSDVEGSFGIDPTKVDPAGVSSDVEGSSVEGSSVEGSSVEGSTVEGSTVEGSTVEGSTVEGSSGVSSEDGLDESSSIENVIQPTILPTVIKQDSKQIDISNYVNDKEDYSLVNIWKGIVYKQRYIYLLVVIIFLIDFVGADIIDQVYSYLVALGVFLIILFFGYFFNLLICKPPPTPPTTTTGSIEMVNIQHGGGNYFTDFLLNKFKNITSRKNEFFIDYINYFSKENPITILNKYKSYFKTNTCNTTINNMSLIEYNIKSIIDTIISIKEDDSSKDSIGIPIKKIS
jgi:hypothetical protein